MLTFLKELHEYDSTLRPCPAASPSSPGQASNCRGEEDREPPTSALYLLAFAQCVHITQHINNYFSILNY